MMDDVVVVVERLYDGEGIFRELALLFRKSGKGQCPRDGERDCVYTNSEVKL